LWREVTPGVWGRKTTLLSLGWGCHFCFWCGQFAPRYKSMGWHCTGPALRGLDSLLVSLGDLKGFVIDSYLSLFTGPALRGLESLLESLGYLKGSVIDSYLSLFTGSALRGCNRTIQRTTLLLFTYVGNCHYMQADVMPHTPLKLQGPEPNLHEGTSVFPPTRACDVIWKQKGEKPSW
jgi:hypothetical protein